MRELYLETELKMKHAVDHFHDDLKRIRTGRASLSILEGVEVEYYGNQTPLNQLCNLSVADATLIVAQPWDTSQIPAIEKAISKANLGLNPSSDGKVVRIPVPALTEERRKELVRQAHDIAETTRNAVRQARREGNDQLKVMEREKEISEDDEHRGHDEMQRLHDHYLNEVNSSLEAKETDIMTV